MRAISILNQRAPSRTLGFFERKGKPGRGVSEVISIIVTEHRMAPQGFIALMSEVFVHVNYLVRNPPQNVCKWKGL